MRLAWSAGCCTGPVARRLRSVRFYDGPTGVDQLVDLMFAISPSPGPAGCKQGVAQGNLPRHALAGNISR
ncbi:hypothetical protein MTIM_45130 [Mycobacterium timonense]|jgi:hypothetical protein|uniref:Uncharacterized protein n=1 Tax=Mycobacterium timonense TaxID=701043 RepID=A0A7I9ZC69_9MYCO|nr:hypothetical protein MTIM_45130 [Mycobacterium timonense]